MADWACNAANFTPSTTQDNWALDPSTNTIFAKVIMINWGGSAVAAVSAGYRTRWYRPTTIGSGTFSALTAPIQAVSNPGATALMRIGTFGTALTPPADPGALFDQPWNPLGGGGIFTLPITREWQMFSAGTAAVAGQIGCRNAAGVDASLTGYGVQWSE